MISSWIAWQPGQSDEGMKMGNVGRPRQFSNAAEKQKAYRNRKKQEKALQNSSGNEDYHYDLRAEVDYWEMQDLQCRFADDWLKANPQKTFEEWQNLRRQVFENWSKAHSAWYKAGMPDRIGKTS